MSCDRHSRPPHQPADWPCNSYATSTLCRDSSKLADVLAAAIAAQAGAEASTARVVEAARREERQAAAERLQQALEEARRMHRDR